MSTELTLQAALRDAEHDQPTVRQKAIRNLAPALLEEFGKKTPLFTPTHEDENFQITLAQVLDFLVGALNRDGDEIRAWALIGLGQLGRPEILEPANAIIQQSSSANPTSSEGSSGPTPSTLINESAIIGLSFLGVASSDAQKELNMEGSSNEAITTLQKATSLLFEALEAPLPELRFQAATALAENGSEDAERAIARALEKEENAEVQENLVRAISMFDPPAEESCNLLAQLLAQKSFSPTAHFEATLALAAARRIECVAELMPALENTEQRDRALEALAVMGPAAAQAEPKLSKRIEKLESGWRTPALTKVRAAYALASIVPKEGVPRLRRLQNSFRPSIRSAAQDAAELLEQLRQQS